MDKDTQFYRAGSDEDDAQLLPAAGDAQGSGAVAAHDGLAGQLRNFRPNLAALICFAGILALIVPTMIFVANETWSGEEGAHGPIVLMTGLWLLWRKWPSTRHLASPPAMWKVAAIIVPLLALYMLARVTQIVELEGYLMYAAVLAAVYGVVGSAVLRKLVFPLVYLAFMFPPPETLVYALTMPLKIGISETAIAFLRMFGYPIGGTGVTIQIGQYQLLVAAACAGLNSIVSLSALTTFYIYIRHAENLRYSLILLLCVIPVAVAANFVRVLILILLTYHAGEAVAQSFVHDLAGLTMFALALVFMFLIDCALGRFFARRRTGPEQTGAAL